MKNDSSEWILDYLLKEKELVNAKKRFWSRVRKTESCWIWIGPLNGRGYGNFRPHNNTWARKNIPTIGAHRFSMLLSVGKEENMA